MEVRDRYNSPREAESFRKFVAGEPDNLAYFQNWLGMVREATAEGCRFSRVRFASMPLTNYGRFPWRGDHRRPGRGRAAQLLLIVYRGTVWVSTFDEPFSSEAILELVHVDSLIDMLTWAAKQVRRYQDGDAV